MEGAWDTLCPLLRPPITSERMAFLGVTPASRACGGKLECGPSRPGREGPLWAYNAALSFRLLADRLVLDPTLS